MPRFIVDKQTIDDLNIFGKHGKNSVYALFNVTHTRGGASLMEEMFRNPMCDPSEIRTRSEAIRYFYEREMAFPFSTEIFDIIDTYLSNVDKRTQLAPEDDNLKRKVSNLLGADTDFEQLQKGVVSVIEFICSLKDLYESTPDDSPYRPVISVVKPLLDEETIQFVYEQKGKKKLSYQQVSAYDRILRFSQREQIKKALHSVYVLDVFLSAARVAHKNNFSFAEVVESDRKTIELTKVFHPLVKGAIANSISVNPDKNVIFLTGANMAGKSTFMKTFSIAIYLAHMGFPVPAQKMRFTAQGGMFTTINLADNINMGYSHFYAEVKRIKTVAKEVGQARDLIVIFDELFRGTNVKDAFDATIAVTEAFACNRNSMFVISTHIIEAADVLKKDCDNINYLYLPTVMENGKPRYTYQLEEGVTADRHGMIIVRNEKILDILDGKETMPVNPEEMAGGTKGDFKADRQTLEDLNITGRYKLNSIFNLFDQTRTRGGGKLLERMFMTPMTDSEAINARSAIFEHFKTNNIAFPLDMEEFDVAEAYMEGTDCGSSVQSLSTLSKHKLMGKTANVDDYAELVKGASATVNVLKKLKEFVDSTPSGPCKARFDEMSSLLSAKDLQFTEVSDNLIKFHKVHYCLKHLKYNEVKKVLDFVYELDLYTGVADVARDRGFCRAEAVEGENLLELRQVYHPRLRDAVANDISIDTNDNLFFLTGANMAGKSTLMKSVSIALYLAHMGFPVAAASMRFSVLDGMYTSINVSDNLNVGYSHFYAEVMRVKNVAAAVSSGKKLLVVFDELFKGTNVKDAYDATVAVIQAFAAKRHCTYVVSTHITEAGHYLQEHVDNIQCRYVPTEVIDGVPKYLYVLRDGISSDRHGMMIVKNERIIETIKERNLA